MGFSIVGQLIQHQTQGRYINCVQAYLSTVDDLEQILVIGINQVIAHTELLTPK